MRYVVTNFGLMNWRYIRLRYSEAVLALSLTLFSPALVFQSKFMEWDEEMALDRSKPGKTGMKAKTSNLNDELALVQYVFSDKTGTLTGA